MRRNIDIQKYRILKDFSPISLKKMLSYRKICDNRALIFYFTSLLLFLVLVVEVNHPHNCYN
jgi:hypothetical protein